MQTGIRKPTKKMAETEEFNRTYSRILFETTIGKSLHHNLREVELAIRETNDIINNSPNKRSDDTPYHVCKSRLMYLGEVIRKKIEETNKA